MVDTDDEPTCVTTGCDEPGYHDREHCHNDHREHRMTLRPGMTPAR